MQKVFTKTMHELYKICLVQADIDFKDIQNNFNNYRTLLQQIKNQPDLIVFPEMFSCGFSDILPDIVSDIQEESLTFLKRICQTYKCSVVATMPIQENDKIFNRLFWIDNTKIVLEYDKSHLFFGVEKQYFTKGQSRQTCQHKTWNFLPLTCYDMRFPQWCRNQWNESTQKILYDCLIFSTNFPSARSKVFDILSSARAIENQTFVVSVNRVGLDGFGVAHNGKSKIIDPSGRILAELPKNEQGILEYNLDKTYLERFRDLVPIYKDWDK